jgi:hypothetical protein
MDWREGLGVVAGVGTVLATVPYITAAARQTIRPSPLAWGGGATTSLIVFTAQMTSEPSWSAVLPGVAAVYCTIILFFALRHEHPPWSKVDALCLILAVAAVIGWQLTGVPEVALALSIAADLFVFTPMVIKTAHEPGSEIPVPFLLKAVCAMLAAISARRFDVLSVSWPLYLAAINALIGYLALSDGNRPRGRSRDEANQSLSEG